MNIAFNEDCIEVMRRYPDQYFDLAVVDPPYGDIPKGGYMNGTGGGAPSAMVLQKMEKAGYDVMYILTGRKSQPALPVTEDELRHLINDTIAYIWRLEERGLHDSGGYISRKALLKKLKQFEQDHFPQLDQCDG